MGLDVKWAQEWLRLSAKAMAEHRVELIELDRPIGDSDHGENMDRGFQAVLQKLDESPPETAGAALKAAAMALMSKVGGAAGPLYGTAYLRAATSWVRPPTSIPTRSQRPSSLRGMASWHAARQKLATRQ